MNILKKNPDFLWVHQPFFSIASRVTWAIDSESNDKMSCSVWQKYVTIVEFHITLVDSIKIAIGDYIKTITVVVVCWYCMFKSEMRLSN